MSHNTFGHLFRVTTWGESHGPAIGCVVDGCPPGFHRNLQADCVPDARPPGYGVPVAPPGGVIPPRRLASQPSG